MWDDADELGLKEATKMGLQVVEWSQAERDYFTKTVAPISQGAGRSCLARS